MFQVRVSPFTPEMLGYAQSGAPERQAMISIVDHQRDARERYPATRVLRLCFEDAEDADCGQNLITYEQAEAICRFVLRYRGEIDTLIVHCSAGVSRSPAVAAAIVKGLGESDEAIWDDSRYCLNGLVYTVVLAAFENAREDGLFL